jgi:hypothetical protein
MSLNTNATVDGVNPDTIPSMKLSEFQAKLDTDSEFRTNYLKDPAAYEEKIIAEDSVTDSANPQGQQGPQSTSPNATNNPEAEDNIKVQINGESVDVPKNLFGYYLSTGKTPAQALVEALKGIREKDTTIQFLRQKEADNTNQTTGLKRSLEEYKKNQAQQAEPSAVAKKPEDIEIDVAGIDAITADDDALFDPENRKKLAVSLKALVSGIHTLNQKVAQTDLKATSIQSKAIQEDIERKSALAQQDSINREFQEIEELFTVEPKLKPAVKFAELDGQVHQFMRDVGYISGTGGEWNDATLNAVRTYYAQTPEGEALRTACEQKGIRPPEDINKHTAVMKLRAVKNTYRDKIKDQMEKVAGRQLQSHEVEIPFTYSDFYLQEKARGTDVAQIVLQAVVRNHEVAGRAANPANMATEIPPEKSAGPISLEAFSEKDLQKLFLKDSSAYTAEEASIYKQWCDANQVPVPKKVLDKISSAQH